MFSNTSMLRRGAPRGFVWAALISCGAALWALTPIAFADPDGTGRTQSIRTYHLPAGPLGSALSRFASESGISLSYSPDLVEGRSAPALRGAYPVMEGLRILLAGSDLIVVEGRSGGYRLQKHAGPGQGAVQLDAINVKGEAPQGRMLAPEYAGGQVAAGGRLGVLGNRDVLDTPFNQTSYTAELIENLQARTIADVIANDSSVQASWPASGYSSPLMIRGFAASNQDVAFDGLYGVAPTFTVDVDMAERVEILKGPSALLSGMQPTGSVGGSINLVPKRAGDLPLTRLSATFVEDSQFGGKVDLGRRMGENKAFGVRFNGSWQEGDANVDDQSRREGSAVLGMDYRADSWRASLDLGYQEQYVDAPALITFLSAGLPVPDEPDNDSNWFFPWSWVDIDDTFGALRGELDVNDHWTVYAAAGVKETHWSRLSYFGRVVDADGNLNGTPGALQYRYLTDSQEIGSRNYFDTGAIGHQLTLSTTRFRQRTDSASVSIGPALDSNLYDPADVPAPAVPDLDPSRTGDNLLSSVAITDTLSMVDDRLQLTLGVRRQSIKTSNFNATGARTSRYDDSALTPSGAVVFKLAESLSVYANYIEGLQQGTVVGNSYTNQGETLEPYKSKQYELGVKKDWGRLMTTLSAFQITQPSGVGVPDGRFEIDGEQRNRGLEFNLFGEIRPGLRLLGGFTVLDATLTETGDGANEGNDAPGVPEFQANVSGEWDPGFLNGLTLQSRLIHTSEQPVDNANTQELDSWNRVDLGARYVIRRVEHPITLRLNVENLLDKDYWSSSAYYPGYLTMGAPRTVLFSVSIDL